jgi:gliding motility-associated-like protein
MSVLDFPVDAGIDTTIQQGENIQLEGSTTESDIMWSPSYAMNNATILNPIVDPDETTTYFLTVDNGTCSITDEMTVFVENNLTVPNTFSPNGDGINDDWEILGINQFPDCTIQVYTRWGQLVFQSTGYSLSKRWDGTSKNGKPLVAGAYYYVINLRSDEFDKPLKGTVSIVK